MADKKITELTNITGVNLVDADEFVVVDISADETKAITLGELKNAFDTGSGFVRITGDTMTGDLALSGADVTFGDNDKAIFGAGSDLQIYHDGSHSRIDEQGTGVLFLQTNGTNIQLNKGTSENMLVANVDGSVDLYYDNSKKLATTSTGIDVTGTVTADSLTVQATSGSSTGVIRSAAGSNSVLLLDTQDTSSVSYITASGSLGIATGSGTPQRMVIDSSGSVGIGATSISGVLTLQKNQAASSTAGTGTTLTLNGDANAGNPWEIFRDNGVTGDLVFSQDASGTRSEHMRLASGNLLVGTTDANLYNTSTETGVALRNNEKSAFSRDGGVPLYINRLSTDGGLLYFQKDGSTVGSIGSQGGDLVIGTGDTGIKTVDTVDAIVPYNTTTNSSRDAAIDLGYNTNRFKDLHLSGGIEIENGTGNVGVGKQALNSNTASNNTAVGYQAAYTNISDNISAFGWKALYNNISGEFNIALGNQALLSNTTGASNTASGYQALVVNTTGVENTALGYTAGASNTTSSYSTFIGKAAGYYSTGAQSTYVGEQSGYYITSGAKNTILGRYNGNQGGLDIRTSSNNIVLADGDGNPRVNWNSSGQAQFRSTSSASESALNSSLISGDGLGAVLNIFSARPNNDAYFNFVGSNTANTVTFKVLGTGNVQNTNNSYAGISDVKLKENIVNASSQWDDIKALTVRKYSMKEDNLDAPNRLGVIAQEVEAAGMSGLVLENIDRDEDMNDLGTVTKAVNYSILYMKAVKALQEAMTRIETLEAKVTALENS